MGDNMIKLELNGTERLEIIAVDPNYKDFHKHFQRRVEVYLGVFQIPEKKTLAWSWENRMDVVITFTTTQKEMNLSALILSEDV